MKTDLGMPVIFIGHGSPTNALEDNEATRAWRRIADSMPRPKAILAISAHWCTRGAAVTAMTRPDTIHDFGKSLPANLFTLEYPAPGDPELAGQVHELLAPSVQVHLDHSWGLDHGTWAVLLKAYPAADIPVVQLSLDLSRPLEWHVETGRRLQTLRDEGVLIMGTGNIVHNLAVMDWDPASAPYDWAERFNRYIRDNIIAGNVGNICTYQQSGNDALLSVPTLDHFCPLLYVLGARRETDQVKFDTDFIQYRSLGMTSVIFSPVPL